jgi:hypothetical protein
MKKTVHNIRYFEKVLKLYKKNFGEELQTFLRLFSHYTKVRIKSRDEIIQK